MKNSRKFNKTAFNMAGMSPSGKALRDYEKILASTGGKESPYYNHKKYTQLMRYYHNKLTLFNS